MLRSIEIRIHACGKIISMDEDYRKAMSDLAKDIVVRKYFEQRQAAREDTFAKKFKRAILWQKNPGRKAEVIDAFEYLEGLARPRKKRRK